LRAKALIKSLSNGTEIMLDAIFLGLGLGGFVLLALYAAAARYV